MEELKESVSIQEWLDKRIQKDIENYRVRAKNHIIDEDIFNYVYGRQLAWEAIRNEGERVREKLGLAGSLSDGFYQKVEGLIPLSERLLRLVREGVNKEISPEFKEVSRQWAEKAVKLMDEEEKIYRSLPEETLREIREQEAEDTS